MKRFSFVFLGLLTVPFASGAIVYDNITDSTNLQFIVQDWEIADDLSLTSVNPINRISFDVFSSSAVTATIIARVYERTALNAPINLLGSATSTFSIAPGESILSIDMPNVQPLSPSVWVSYQVTNWATTSGPNLLLGGTPTVGGSSTSYASRSPGGSWNVGPTPGLNGRFGIRVESSPVPEPATLLTVALGAGMLVRKRRRQL